MRIRVASDLHLEAFRGMSLERLEEHFLPPDPRDGGAVLALAGDISSDLAQLAAFIRHVAPRFEKVAFVPGNHEYYRHDYDDWNHEASGELVSIPNLWAAPGYVAAGRHEGILLVLGTLWADGGGSKESEQAVSQGLNDFRLISRYGRPLTVSGMADIHARHKEWIETHLDTRTPAVVITHHLPSRRLCHPRFGTDLNGGFASNCDHLVHGPSAPLLWIHGHTHDTIDTVIGGTRVVCNPAGYRGEWHSPFNSYFSTPKFVEVNAQY